jgi:uncharacterized membrane protein
MADTIGRETGAAETSDAAHRWERVEAALDQLNDALAALDAQSHLIGPELVAALRARYFDLRRELSALRDSYPDTAQEGSHALERMKERADMLLAATRREAREAYDRVRSVATDPNTRQAVKESLGEIGRGAARAGREIATALGAAFERLRQEDTSGRRPDEPHTPPGEPPPPSNIAPSR